jgi:hypothetical protein
MLFVGFLKVIAVGVRKLKEVEWTLITAVGKT